MNYKQVRSIILLGMAATLIPGIAMAVVFPGPDSFGYLANTIPFDLRDVSATGIDIGLDNADDSTAVAPIGFSFPFYGVNYTQVEVSSNGFLTFTPTGAAGCCSGLPIPTPGGINNFIAGYWEDLYPGGGGAIRAQTLGAVGSREFVVGYYEVPDLDDPANSVNTFELILHEGTGNIELQLAQIQYDRVDHKVVGIENQDGTDGIEIAYFSAGDPNYINGDILFQDQAYLISRVPEPGTLALVVVLLPLWIGGSLARRSRIR